MRIIFGIVVADTNRGLLRYIENQDPSWSVGVWDTGGSLATAISALEELRPDVLVIAPEWFVFSAVLRRMVKLSGCPDPLLVLASANVTNALKVEAAYHGFRGLIDLAESDAVVFGILRDAASGKSRLDGDRLWTSVTRPAPKTDLSLIPDDDVDRGILDLIRIGLSDREIAETLFFSHQTVRNRVSRMLTDAGLDNRTHLAWAYTNAKLLEGLFMRSDHLRSSQALGRSGSLGSAHVSRRHQAG